MVLRIAVDCPLRTLLDYLPPPGESGSDLPLGARVRVPFGARSAIGVIVAHAQGSALPGSRLKAITALLDPEPLLDAALLELLQWTAGYYHHPPGEVIAAAIPAA
jgi:primosomal protein N' (replication factor Y)